LSTPRLNPFSYVVLALVGRDGAGPHDLAQMAERGRVYGDFAKSQWYAEPKRLEKLGCLTSRKEAGRTRPRTHYTLTEKGREALRAWMEEPTGFSRMQLEPAWRLMAADLVGDEAVLESLRPLRREAEALLDAIGSGEEAAGQIPYRERYLRLNHRLARRIVEAHLEWLDEVEAELGEG
jgi:DNA-binding PadR family transcriptional regulator